MTKLALEKRVVTFVALALVAVAGIRAYFTMPQAQDPGFVIRTAVVTTILPGASPERVEELVTTPVEEHLQQIPELDFLQSESLTGLSIVYVNIKEKYTDMRPIFDNVRRKVDAAAADLPDGVIGPAVNDEFGDVYGIIYTLTGEGFSDAELKKAADDVRDELLRLPDVAKVEVLGAQDERIFIEYDNATLAQIGLSPLQLQQMLRATNIIYPGGKLNIGRERIVLEPSGNYESIEELRRTPISVPALRDVLYLEDIADVRRGYVEPEKSKVRSTGERALALAVSMSEGGNIVALGSAADGLLAGIQADLPVGLEFDKLYFQPRLVEKDVANFVNSLLQAVAIVVGVMLLTLGVRTGLVVASLIPMAMVASLLLMSVFGVTLNQISIAALIIALGMLVDNAIVMSESILVAMGRGKRAVPAALEAAAELKVPLLTSSLTTAAAFLPIYLAESSTGEYTAHLFVVVTIALLSSWVLSLTMIPLLAVLFIRVAPGAGATEAYDSWLYRGYRSVLMPALRRRWLTVALVVGIFVGSLGLATRIPQVFFPSTDWAFLRATINLPVGTPLEVTDAMVADLEGYLRTEWLAGPERTDGVVNWLSFIGVGSPRYTLSAQVDPEKPELCKLLINTTDRAQAEALKVDLEQWLGDRYADAEAVINPLDNGPPVTAPIQVRISGRDLGALYRYVDEVKERLRALQGARGVTDDWGPRVKKLRINVDQPRARRADVSSSDIAMSLQAALSGIEVTSYREQEDVIPVVMRSDAAEHLDVNRLETLDVFAQSTGATVPLGQVADIAVLWEPSVIHRRDLYKTITVEAQLDEGASAFAVVAALEEWLRPAAAGWPLGYGYEMGGEVESSQKANESIMAKLPIGLMIILLLLVAQFNNLSGPLIIVSTIPLALIGVVLGLLALHGDMGFMTFLGVISLAGIVINNAIVLLDRIRIEIEGNGRRPAAAVVAAAQERLRPILLTTGTTLGGLLPLYFGGGPMWTSMAIAIMAGLLFSTALTLVVVPVLYSLFHRVSYRGFALAELTREPRKEDR